MKPSPELTAYNLGVATAVKANRADRLAEQGVCVVCERRRRKMPARLCHRCIGFTNAASQQRARDRKKAS